MNWMIIAGIVALSLTAILGLTAYAASEKSEREFKQKEKGTTTSTTPPTPATSKLTVKSLWIRRIIFAAIWIPLAAFVVIPWVSSLRKPTVPPAPARTQAPMVKREPQKLLAPPFYLDLVGGDGIFNKDGFIGVQRGGRAFFATHTLPWRRDAMFHVVVKLFQKNTATIFIKINEQVTKTLVHPGSPNFTPPVVFFEAGETGGPDYFKSGANNIEVWSNGDEMTIQSVSIEILG